MYKAIKTKVMIKTIVIYTSIIGITFFCLFKVSFTKSNQFYILDIILKLITGMKGLLKLFPL